MATPHLTSTNPQSTTTNKTRTRKPRSGASRRTAVRRTLAPQGLTSANGRETYTLLHGDCIEEMRTLEANSVDAVVTDAPYGIRLMGEGWDGADISAKVAQRRALVSADTAGAASSNTGSGGYPSVAAEAGKDNISTQSNREFQQWTSLWVSEALRVLKPGGYLVVFASPRTYHRMAAGAEDAGAEILGQLMWVFGSGMPKSRNVARYDGLSEWLGYGTALKPAHEPILLARKPLDGTYAQNVAKHRAGLLNIDGCRIRCDAGNGSDKDASVGCGGGWNAWDKRRTEPNGLGRWPSTVLLDENAALCLEDQAPGKSRFFYVAKPSRAERDAGLDQFADANPFNRPGSSANFERMGSRSRPRKNGHPTVKPIDLMRQLCRLVTPPGGVVMDPFLGSGTTGCAVAQENADPDQTPGWTFVGIEREPDYLAIARARIEYWMAADADDAPQELAA
jgi:DNA modification methylase